MKVSRHVNRAKGTALFAVGGSLGIMSSIPSLTVFAWAICAAVGATSAVFLILAWRLRAKGPRLAWESAPHEIARKHRLKRDWDWLTTDEQLAQYEELASSLSPEHGYPGVEKLKLRISRNPKLVFGIYETSDGRRRLEGCFVAYPLRRRPLALLRDGTWTNARSISKFDLTSRWRSARGLYIAALVARDTPSRARIIEEVYRFARVHDDIPILARAASKEGLRIIRRFGMRPVANPDDIWIWEPLRE